jgi:bifunctional DNA-binding transcriptional regulator/antitoxin component of YhaV-PrlF toxin-antitoxin module
MSGYSLLIDKKVKKQPGRTRISSKHQVTIPVQALRSAGLEPGDVLRAQADGAGRVLLTRVDELVDRYSGCVNTNGALREQVRGLRGEWR